MIKKLLNIYVIFNAVETIYLSISFLFYINNHANIIKLYWQQIVYFCSVSIL